MCSFHHRGSVVRSVAPAWFRRRLPPRPPTRDGPPPARRAAAEVASIALGGLFFYDIFWVFFSERLFGSNVMVEVATKVGRTTRISAHVDAFSFSSLRFVSSLFRFLRATRLVGGSVAPPYPHNPPRACCRHPPSLRCLTSFSVALRCPHFRIVSRTPRSQSRPASPCLERRRPSSPKRDRAVRRRRPTTAPRPERTRPPSDDDAQPPAPLPETRPGRPTSTPNNERRPSSPKRTRRAGRREPRAQGRRAALDSVPARRDRGDRAARQGQNKEDVCRIFFVFVPLYAGRWRCGEVGAGFCTDRIASRLSVTVTR